MSTDFPSRLNTAGPLMGPKLAAKSKFRVVILRFHEDHLQRFPRICRFCLGFVWTAAGNILATCAGSFLARTGPIQIGSFCTGLGTERAVMEALKREWNNVYRRACSEG